MDEETLGLAVQRTYASNRGRLESFETASGE